jgi:hypothetical protein
MRALNSKLLVLIRVLWVNSLDERKKAGRNFIFCYTTRLLLNTNMSAIDKYLLVNGIVIFLAGFTMYMKPSMILGSVHNESVSRDTLSVMSGWG